MKRSMSIAWKWESNTRVGAEESHLPRVSQMPGALLSFLAKIVPSQPLLKRQQYHSQLTDAKPLGLGIK